MYQRVTIKTPLCDNECRTSDYVNIKYIYIYNRIKRGKRATAKGYDNKKRINYERGRGRT